MDQKADAELHTHVGYYRKRKSYYKNNIFGVFLYFKQIVINRTEVFQQLFISKNSTYH